MVTESRVSKLPPYVSYKSFCSFLAELEQGVPARIDRSFWGERLSGSTGAQLMVALRFLGLMDQSSVPTTQLRQLAIVKGDRRSEVLNEIMAKAYGWFLQGDSLDLQTATLAQLQEVFKRTFQLTEDLNRKCLKFYVEMAHDSGLLLSPHITKHFRNLGSGNSIRTITRKKDIKALRPVVIPQPTNNLPLSRSWDEMLISKFPNFDPAWSDDIKLKWFSAFDELMKRNYSH